MHNRVTVKCFSACKTKNADHLAAVHNACGVVCLGLWLHAAVLVRCLLRGARQMFTSPGDSDIDPDASPSMC